MASHENDQSGVRCDYMQTRFRISHRDSVFTDERTIFEAKQSGAVKSKEIEPWLTLLWKLSEEENLLLLQHVYYCKSCHISIPVLYILPILV